MGHAQAGTHTSAHAVASRIVSPLTKLTIKSLATKPKASMTSIYKCVRKHTITLLGHSLYGKAHGARAAGQYSYCPNHILGDMNIALVLVSFTAYSGSAWHFDPHTLMILLLVYSMSYARQVHSLHCYGESQYFCWIWTPC